MVPLSKGVKGTVAETAGGEVSFSVSESSPIRSGSESSPMDFLRVESQKNTIITWKQWQEHLTKPQEIPGF